MSGDHWVLAYTVPTTQAPVPVPIGVQIEEGHPLAVGRTGQLPVGVDLPDSGISRVAVMVTATRDGWSIEVTNRNGATLHPWGLAPAVARTHTLVAWPLVGILVRGSVAGAQHWVLLESSMYTVAVPSPDPSAHSANRTSVADPPPALTGPELEALGVVFGSQLAWPPVVPAPALQLKQAARRLGITDSAVQQRLGNAQRKATRLGLTRRGSLTEPDYLHVLVGAGYVPVTATRAPRRHLSEAEPAPAALPEVPDEQSAATRTSRMRR